MYPSSQDPGSFRVARRLCIVARNHPLLFGYLSTLFRDRPVDSEQIELVIDRRHPEAPRPAEVERRRPSQIDEELRRRGFAFVVEPGETFRPRDAARIEHTVGLLAGMEDGGWPFRRRRRRPVLERMWGKRAGRTLAIMTGVALLVALASSEFRMSDLRDSDAIRWPLRSLSRIASSTAPSEKSPANAPEPVVTPPPPPAVAPAVPPVPTTTAPTAPAPVAVPSVPPTPPPAALPPPAPHGPASPTPTSAKTAPSGPATPAKPPAPKAMAASEPPAVSKGTAGSAPSPAPVALPDRPRSLASSSAPPPMAKAAAREPASVVSTRAPVAPISTPPPAPMSGDLRIELSRKATSATGGGVVFMVRVTDLSGQPLSDAEVSMLAGRRPGGALFETRLYPADAPGMFRSGVIHPSTLPPDLTVMAVSGSRRVETLVAR